MKPARIVAAAMFVATLVGCAAEHEMSTNPRAACVDATDTLLQAAESDDPVIRAHAMEALAELPEQDAGHVFMEGLEADAPLVRFSAAMAIGDTGYEPAKEQLREMAEQSEPDKRVLAAIVYALHTLGEDSYTSMLGPLLFDREPEVRANAALAMGKIGEPSAIEPLRKILRDEREISVQMEIVEAMAALGDERSRRLLESYTKTQFMDDRLRGIQAMARVKPQRAPEVFANLTSSRQPPPVRVAAIGGLARVGDMTEDSASLVSREAYEYCVRAAQQPRDVLIEAGADPEEIGDMDIKRLQRLAARSLGWIDNPAGVDVLFPLLKSSDGSVRVAAAMGILRLLEGRFEPDEPEEAPEEQTEVRTRPGLHTSGGRD
ncbi:MAG: HEAT repeat domain-containing protein [Planctomycetota bacterium]